MVARFFIAPKALAMGFKSWLSLRGKTSPAPGEDVTVGDKRGNLARERLRGLFSKSSDDFFSVFLPKAALTADFGQNSPGFGQCA